MILESTQEFAQPRSVMLSLRDLGILHRNSIIVSSVSAGSTHRLRDCLLRNISY